MSGKHSVDPDQMSQNVASDLGLHCLLRPVCPNIKDYYGIGLWARKRVLGMPLIFISL